LIKPDGKLCFDCHEDVEKKIKAAKLVHQPVENGDCSSCHDPHANDRKKLLSKSAPTLCWDCHDNFLEKAAFKHDVVEDCASCHDIHQSAESKLLLKPRGVLCLDCHEEKDLKAVKGHEGSQGKSCVECHDPHVGRDKYLLKAASGPTSAPGKTP
jgi:predicted CXXCH cytochrome family protein